jgi:hypothetical protein
LLHSGFVAKLRLHQNSVLEVRQALRLEPLVWLLRVQNLHSSSKPGLCRGILAYCFYEANSKTRMKIQEEIVWGIGDDL